MTETDLAVIAGFALAAFVVLIVWANIMYSRSTEEEKEAARDDSQFW